MSRVRDILAALDPTVKASESELSYVECLVPRSQWSKAVLLHRAAAPSKDLPQLKTVVSDDPEQSAFDVTGSPLAYDLSYPEVDETIVDWRNWRKGEEFHLPLATSESREVLNCCLEHLPDNGWSLPVLALCDGKDKDRTILLGSYVGNERFTTILARVSDTRKLSHIKETRAAALLEEYTKKFSVPEHKVCTAVRSAYELCGKRPGIEDSVNLTPNCFVGNLSIEVNWNTLSFDAPIRDSASTLVMEVIPGWDGSNLKNLWRQLTLLYQHLNTLEQSRAKEQLPYKFASSNSTSWDDIEPLLNRLMNGEKEEKSCQDDNDDNAEDVAHDVKLKKHVDNIDCRQNMDFADLLWELLITCSNYAQMMKCIDAVLQKVQSGFTRPQNLSTNSTRIGNVISDIIYQKRTVPILDENLTLELLIDAGLEKLSRDYIYILLSANLVDLNDIRQILCNIPPESFTIESYRKKLAALGQIHLCLEFTLIAENHINCPNENIRSIFTYAFQTYVSKNSAIKSFVNLYENRLQCLKVPLSTSAVQDIVKGLPSSWCVTLSSESKVAKNTSTSYFSRTPILPPNIYCFDESNDDEVYYSLKFNSSSFKIA